MIAELRPVAVVTGAGRSLGRAIAARLHDTGYRVAVTDLDPDAAGTAARELDASGKTARAYGLDVRRVGDIGQVFQRIADELGPPAALVNNAGIYPDHGVLDMSEEAWDAVLDTNLKGTFFCSQAFARLAVERGAGGAIVNIASTAAFSARAGAAHYSASKAGIVMLTKSLAQELGELGVRVNAVAPGLIEVRPDQVSDAYRENFLRMVPQGRTGKAADVAGTVVFLLSGEADYVSGACLVVDGGFLTGRPLIRSRST